jgi:hypothetical protein
MTLTRRTFMVGTTYVCARAALSNSTPTALWAAGEPQLAPYLTGMRMAETPATAYRAYRSKAVMNPEVTTWIQVDLKRNIPIDVIQLFPASERMYPGCDQYYGGEGFPMRLDNITQYTARGIRARYVRLTASRLRAVKVAPTTDLPLRAEPRDGSDYTLTIAKMAVISAGHDAAVGCKVSADEGIRKRRSCWSIDAPAPARRRRHTLRQSPCGNER